MRALILPEAKLYFSSALLRGKQALSLQRPGQPFSCVLKMTKGSAPGTSHSKSPLIDLKSEAQALLSLVQEDTAGGPHLPGRD